MSDSLSIPPDAGTECNEHRAMKRRLEKYGLPDYSKGHQRMYGGPIELLRGEPCSIIEVGFGIGYGLKLMDSSLRLSSYFGVEPCSASFEYVFDEVVEKLKQRQTVTLTRGLKLTQTPQTTRFV